jgi:hypothetical protein
LHPLDPSVHRVWLSPLQLSPPGLLAYFSSNEPCLVLLGVSGSLWCELEVKGVAECW